MKLSAEQVYDELNGEEVKAILLERVRAMLDGVPDFQRHLTVPRVRMLLNIHLDIYGRRVPLPNLVTDLTLRTDQMLDNLEIAKQLEAEDQVNADTGVPVPNTPFDGTGDPPDQIREENGLPVMDVVKTRVGTFQRPAAPSSDPNLPLPASAPGGRPYAAQHVIQRGGPVVRGYVDYLPGHGLEHVATPQRSDVNKGEPGKPAPVQEDFLEAHRTSEK